MAIDFNTEPYFDDYKSEKDFYRILFRPSYAVQARELTQLQTILQNQVSRFGDHVFKNGSQVIPGSVNVDNKVHFIKLEQFTGTVDVTTYIETLKNKIITGENSGVKMRVLDTSGGDAVVTETSIPTLYCKVEGTDLADDTVIRFEPGENIVAYTEDNQTTTNFRLTEDQLNDITAQVKSTGNLGETATSYTGNTSSDVLGYGYSVEVQAGIYYIDGVFVRNDNLKLYVGRFNNVPTARVGFKVTQETITPEDDDSILDNATGSYNFAAPGAHRYKIGLTLVSLPLTGQDTFQFIELVRIKNGRVHQKVKNATYSELEKTLARRTYDESGNYEVNKFKLSIREHNDDGTNLGAFAPLVDGEVADDNVIYGDEDKFVCVVDPGKAYIQGYEIESTQARFIEFDKARIIDGDEGNHIQRVGQQSIGLNLGNYVRVNNMYQSPDISNFEKVYLVNKLQNEVATVRPLVSGGVITSFVVDNPGFGYTSAPTVSIVTRTGAGSGATGTATIDSLGRVTGVSVTAGGSNYPNETNLAPVVRLIDNISIGDAPNANEIVGTARIRSVQLASGSYENTRTEYNVGIFDIQMFADKSFQRDVKSFCGLASTDNFTANIDPEFFVLGGTGTTNYDTTIYGQGTLFEDTVNVGDIIYVNDILAGTVASVDSNYQLTLTSNSRTSATNGRLTIFTAELKDPDYETLLFPVGASVVKTLRGFQNGADTQKNTNIIVRRQFPIVNTSTNRPFFELTDTDESFLADVDLANYTLINADSNLPVDIDVDNITFDDNTLRKVVNFENVPNGNYYLIASVQQEQVAAQEKIKVLQKDSGAGSMTITDKKIINANSIDLMHGDIFRLVSVTMTPGSYTYDEENIIDITDRYTLDNGQRPTHYTYGKINLKPGNQVPSGAINIKYEYFSYNNSYEGNYFSVDSYLTSSGISYDEIPTYSINDESTGKKIEISLTDVVDFRPVLTTTNFFKPELPKLGSDMIAPRANYLGRIDKMVLDSFGKFNVIKGVPSPSPKEPDDPKEGLVLATVQIPPYTRNVNNIIIKQRDNRRYTMRDIGRIERRVSNLEYYVSLSLLEKDTATLQIKDTATGLDRFKNGFMVDQFTGHSVGDVKHEDYRIAIDPQLKLMRPTHYTNALEIVEDLSSGSDRGNKTYKKTGDLITLPYTQESYIFNPHASRSMDIHAISMGAFRGQVQLFPEGDNWKNVNRRPDLVAVDDNNYDAIKFMADELGVTGTKWNEWQTHWTAVSSSSSENEDRNFDRSRPAGRWLQVTGYETTVTDWQGYQTRDGITTNLTSTVNAQDYGDRVVDMSYIPYMRSRPVTFVAQNLKNSTRFWPFFDGTAVSEYVKPADKITVTRVGNSVMSFDLNDLQNNIKVDTPARAHNGETYSSVVGEMNSRVEPAFGLGDVLTNTTHTPTSIVSINSGLASTTDVSSFSLVVNPATNILPGHHVTLYNLDYHNAYDVKNNDDLIENQNIPASVGITDNTNTSKELNMKTFRVKSVNGGTLTLENIDGSLIPPFSSYVPGNYNESSGKLYRKKASCVVAHAGNVITSDNIGPIKQEIYVVNVKGGFAVGETLTGSVSIRTTGSYNGITVTEINGSNSSTTAAPMKDIGSNIKTDNDGTAVGVFYLPDSDSLRFRTGERTFKLSDNQSNTDAYFDSVGTAVYYAQGISLDKERTVVSSRSIEFVQASAYQNSRELGLPDVRRSTTSSRVLYQYEYDPLAQTFTVNQPGGAMVTSIDLYFQEAGRRPISVELRPTDNGVPSSSKVIPFSRVTKTPNNINTSDDGSEVTTFTFPSPIYLQDNETYSFVVLTDEPGAKVFVSEMGSVDLITGNSIAGQPLTGALYASQNSREWEINPLLDMKFDLKRAVFATGTDAELFLKCNPPEVMTLGNNPLQITNGSSLIRVYARNHGLLAGDSVTMRGVADGLYGTGSTATGIPSDVLNSTHTVSATGLEQDSFIIDLVTTTAGSDNLLQGTTADFVNGQYGGRTIKISRGMAMDQLYFKSSDLVFSDTNVKYYVKSMNQNGDYTGYVPFVSNSNIEFDERMHIPAIENYVSVDGVVTAPLLIRATLSSTNDAVSPVVDLQKISAFVTQNIINNDSAASINVPEIDTRVVLQNSDIVLADTETAGTGTITVTTASATVSGTGTYFTTEVVPGNGLYRDSDNAFIGTVQTVNSNTSITLTANSAINQSLGAYNVTSAPTLTFENVNGKATISTNIDTADNLLASVGIGKRIVIENVDLNVDGTYNVINIEEVEDKTTYAGNADLSTTKLTLDGVFGATVNMNMITDNDFVISVLDKYVDDTSPYGVHNKCQYITRTLSLSNAADHLRIMFDANIVNNTNVKVYYRTWSGNVNLNKLAWKDTGFTNLAYDAEGKFAERELNIYNIAPFNNVQVKIVMKSSNTVYIPKVKNFRMIALS